MPVVTSVPGVYVEEVPSGVRTITGVATSVTAFVGRARRGPVDAPVRCSSFADFERRLGGLWVASELGHAVAQFFTAGGGEAVVSRVADGATAASVTVPGSSFRLAAAEPGAWGATLRMTISHGTAGTVSATPDDRTFHLTVDEIDPALLATSGYDRAVLARESHPNVSLDPAAPRFVTGVLAQRSRLVRVTGTLPTTRPNQVTRREFTGGGDGTTAGATIEEYDDAIGRLDQVDVVNLLCVPPVDRDTPTRAATWTTAQAWAERRRAVLLVDPSDAWTDAQQAADLTGMTALRSPNTAFYFPRVLGPDPLQQNRPRPFAPSGAVAGLIARTDAERGVWKAPAGTEATLPGVTGFEVALTDDDSGLLNPRGVNALRELSVVGPVAWGARTGRGADVMASEWKYLPVRRLALHIENSLDRGTRWAVFEPNAEPLWAQMRASVTGFLQDLFRQGAFHGTSPREAYLVRCDASTTTPADVATGVVNVLVGFAPLRPAEFVVLTFQQMAGQAA